MAVTQPYQIKELNDIIEEIEKVVKPKQEIGAQSKPVLTNLLKGQKSKKKPVFFKIKREYADQIVAHFITEKHLVRNKFHTNGGEYIFLL
ncbi:hypothetical protein BH09BAC3_BH09BAC3_31710 [soil metagenome]